MMLIMRSKYIKGMIMSLLPNKISYQEDAKDAVASSHIRLYLRL